MTDNHNTHQKKRGRPRRRLTLTVTARLARENAAAWMRLKQTYPVDCAELCRMCMISLLALHLSYERGGKVVRGEEEEFWRNLNLTHPQNQAPLASAQPLTLNDLRGILAPTVLITVRFSDGWADRWQQLCSKLPSSTHAEVLTESIRFADVVLSAEDDTPVFVVTSGMKRVEIKNFLGIV